MFYVGSSVVRPFVRCVDVHNQVALRGTEPLLNLCFGPENTSTDCTGHVGCNSGLKSAFAADVKNCRFPGSNAHMAGNFPDEPGKKLRWVCASWPLGDPLVVT